MTFMFVGHLGNDEGGFSLREFPVSITTYHGPFMEHSLRVSINHTR